MLNVIVHLGSATPFSSRVGPHAPARRACLSAPSPLSLPPEPAHQRQRAAVRIAARARAASRSRPAGTRSGRHPPVGARPHDRPRIVWHPHARAPLPALPSFSPLCRAADRAVQTHHPSRAPPPSPPFPRPDCCLWLPEAFPSRRILLSIAAVFPLHGECPPSFAIPKLELILSSPFHTGAAGPHTRRRCPSELPPRR
jgi:hypothetical protein